MFFLKRRLLPGNESEERRLFLALGVLLTLLVYLPVVGNQFVNWDDDVYIQFNPHIRRFNLSSFQWMFTHTYAGYWIPLTWMSYAFDFWVGRLEPWVYHFTNLILHLLNTALVFVVGLQIAGRVRDGGRNPFTGAETTWVAFGASLLFGLHPLHVESVAWAAERKDLLCAFFYLLSLGAYLKWVEAGGKNGPYYLSLAAFALSLMSKPMAVSLPLVLILLDHWPLGRLEGRLKKCVVEKIPFLSLAALASVVTAVGQVQAWAGWGLSSASLALRLMNACHSIFFYLWKMLLPIHLTAFYPLIRENTFSAEYILSAAGVILAAWTAWTFRQRAPGLTASLCFYLVTLLPVLGLLQAGNQAAADRFAYLPSIGPFLLASGLLVVFSRVWRPFLLVFILVAGGMLGAATDRQVRTWKDSVSLWENVLAYYPNNNLIVHQNLGQAYENAGRLGEALQKYDDAIHPSFNFPQPHWGKGRVLTQLGRYDEAILEYKTALALDPSFPPLYLGLADVYKRTGSAPLAIENLRRAIQLDPHYADAYEDLGEIYLDQAQWEKALQSLQTAYSLDPDNPVYLKNLEQAGNKKASAAKAH